MSGTAQKTTEHKVELESGWSLNRETGNVTAWDGIRIRWRFVGERRWRKLELVPDADLGQTVESLLGRRAKHRCVTSRGGSVSGTRLLFPHRQVTEDTPTFAALTHV